MSEGGFAPLPGVPHAIAQQARSRLDTRVRRKLEGIEEAATAALLLVRVLGDRVEAARRELLDVERQLDWFQTDPTAMARSRYVQRDTRGTGVTVSEPIGGPRDLALRAGDLREEVARLTVRRDAAQARWNALGRLATRCREHLGVTE